MIYPSTQPPQMLQPPPQLISQIQSLSQLAQPLPIPPPGSSSSSSSNITNVANSLSQTAASLLNTGKSQPPFHSAQQGGPGAPPGSNFGLLPALKYLQAASNSGQQGQAHNSNPSLQNSNNPGNIQLTNNAPCLLLPPLSNHHLLSPSSSPHLTSPSPRQQLASNSLQNQAQMAKRQRTPSPSLLTPSHLNPFVYNQPSRSTSPNLSSSKISSSSPSSSKKSRHTPQTLPPPSQSPHRDFNSMSVLNSQQQQQQQSAFSSYLSKSMGGGIGQGSPFLPPPSQSPNPKQSLNSNNNPNNLMSFGSTNIGRNMTSSLPPNASLSPAAAAIASQFPYLNPFAADQAQKLLNFQQTQQQLQMMSAATAAAMVAANNASGGGGGGGSGSILTGFPMRPPSSSSSSNSSSNLHNLQHPPF
jgi:hypothetical protein